MLVEVKKSFVLTFQFKLYRVFSAAFCDWHVLFAKTSRSSRPPSEVSEVFNAKLFAMGVHCVDNLKTWIRSCEAFGVLLDKLSWIFRRLWWFERVVFVVAPGVGGFEVREEMKMHERSISCFVVWNFSLLLFVIVNTGFFFNVLDKILKCIKYQIRNFN